MHLMLGSTNGGIQSVATSVNVSLLLSSWWQEGSIAGLQLVPGEKGSWTQPSPLQPRKRIMLPFVLQAEHELRVAQTEFDRQAELTRLLLEGISSTHVNHLRCLHEFVESQATYYAQGYQYMLDLQKQLGRFPGTFVGNAESTSPPPATTSPTTVAATIPVVPTVGRAPNSATAVEGALNLKDVKPPASGTRKARVLYDYEAADSSELALLADEMITVYSLPGMDPDWLIGERGNQKGKVPVTYLELLS
ncbi:hypothetical protein KIL84_004022 [Mauremys mutica]|uniref:Endophilin-B2 n=1 Tax=Mauremys mutica TaxID=74926 RepID=A0A9D4BBR1_9SAUR|nr:hypothetical protein KIL84_004022 [Mauremys mutica]